MYTPTTIMKRYFLMLAVMLIASVSAIAENTSAVILQHKGKITMFDRDSIKVAMAQAVDGDTILLSRGEFPTVTIDKSITLRGEGSTTGVNTLTVDGGDNVISPTIQSLCSDYYDNSGNWHSTDLVLKGQTDGLKIQDCRFNNCNPTGQHDNITVKRCFTYDTFHVKYSVTSGTFENCRFKSLYFYDSPHPNLVFINITTPYLVLNANSSYSDNAQCTFINSVIYHGSGIFTGSTLINSVILRRSSSGDAYFENCYYPTGNWSDNYDKPEWLTEQGYLGNDGTPIGYKGGQHPYDTYLSSGVPKVSKSKVLLNTEKGTLDVDVEFEYK